MDPEGRLHRGIARWLMSSDKLLVIICLPHFLIITLIRPDPLVQWRVCERAGKCGCEAAHGEY